MRPHINRPRYKSCKTLRQDIWGNLLHKTFRKKKWRELVGRLKTQQRRNWQSKKVIIQSFHHQKLSSFPRYKRYDYQRGLALCLQWRKFYGCEQHYKMRARARRSCHWQDFLEGLETRLDVLLYRCHLTTSIGESRYLIQYGKVFLNGYRPSPNSQVRPGDMITWNSNFQDHVGVRLQYVKRGFLPSYVDMDPYSLYLRIKSKPWTSRGWYPFPAWPKTILEFYKAI